MAFITYLNLAYFTLNISFNSCYSSPRPTSNLSSPNLSPLQRCLCVVGMAGEKKRKNGRGKMGMESEASPCNVRFSGEICGFVVLAKRGDCLDDFEGYWEDNSINEG